MAARKLEVVFVGDTKSLDAAFTRVNGSADGFAGKMQKVGGKMKQTGGAISQGLSLPLLAVGVAAGKLAVDYDASMSEIERLTGVSSKQVAAWSKQVESLSKTLPQSPKELADALYYIVSSGAKVSDAMGILRASSKAAAVGLGDTKVVADAVTSALNAYGSKNISAAKATDVLMGAVREGKAEPEELAAVMGRVVPAAQAMGVSFDQVGAGLASLTLTGNGAEESATQMSAIFSTFMKGTGPTRKALKAMHLDLDDVRKSIKDKGLLPTLIDLRKRTKEYGVDVAQVFPNIRALRGFLTLTGESADKNVGIFARLAHGSGDVDKAFSKLSKSSKARLQSALSTLQVAGIELGRTLVKVFVPIAETVAKVVDAFTKLPFPLQRAVIVFGALVAVIGPLLVIAGVLVTAIGAIAAVSSTVLIVIAAVVAAAVLLAATWQWVAPAVSAAASAIANAVKSAVEWIVTAWENVKDSTVATFNAVVHTIESFVAFIKSVPKAVGDAAVAVVNALASGLKSLPGLLIGAGKWLIDRLVDGIKGSPAALGTAVGWLIGHYILLVKGYITTVVNIGKWIVSRLVDGVKGSPGALSSAASWVKDRIVEFVHNGVGSFLSVGSWVVAKLRDGITGAPGSLASAAGWVKNTFVGFVHDGVDGFTSVGGWVLGKVKAGITGAPGRLVEAAGWLKDHVVSSVHDTVDSLTSLGTWVLQKMLDGILAGPKLIASAAKQFGEALIREVKNVLGIHSPSREFENIGQFVVAGLAKSMSPKNAIGVAKRFFGGMTSLGVSLAKKGLIDLPMKGFKALTGFGKKVFGKLFGDTPNVGNGALSSEQLKNVLSQALKITGYFSPGNLASLTKQALSESAGRPKAINLWDSNAKAGHPSKGLLQTIDSTFNAYKLPGMGDIWNPLHNAVAAIRYMIATYGHIVGTGHGYAQGGMVRARVGELGAEDVLLPNGSRVVQASETARRGDAPLVHIEHATFNDQTDAALFARELGWQFATEVG